MDQAAQGQTLGEINRQFFNANIDKINAPWIQELQQQILQLVQSHIDWLDIRKPSSDSQPVKLLDYACGSGVASRALASSVEVIRGIDVSDGMVEKFNEAAKSAGFLEQQVHAIRGDLLEATNPALNTEDFFDFDIAAVSMALHHVSDAQALVDRLVGRLGVGGTLLIIDGTTPDSAQLQAYLDAQQSDHDPQQMMPQTRRVVSRFGYNAEEMRTLLLKAGCSESSIEYLVNEEVSKIPEEVTGVKGGLENRIFLAKGRRAEAG